MKLLCLSDLHIDVNEKILNRSIREDIVRYIKETDADVVFIAGDISGGSSLSLQVIQELEEKTGKRILFIPGNHDIWTEKDDENASWKSYYELQDHGGSITGKPQVVGDYVIIGDLGWYDYSFGPDYIYNKKEFERKKKQYWNDAKYAKWGRKDAEVCQIFLNKLEFHLEQNKDKKVIFATHTIPYKEFVTVKYSDKSWNFCNAYMGSEKIGQLINRYSNIEYVIFGHTHTKYGMVEFKNKKIICNPFGYVGEWKSESKDVIEELKQTGIIIDLN